MADALNKSDFDPYYQWLGIPPDEQPADHYRLLGLRRFEADPDVIESAADRQMNHVRTYALSARREASQQLLNELAAARVCLLDQRRKLDYDKQLRLSGASDAENQELSEFQKLEPLHGMQPETFGVAPLNPAGSSAPDFGNQQSLGVAGQANIATFRTARPAWKQPHWIAAIICGVVLVFAIAFLIGSSLIQSSEPEDNQGGGDSPIADGKADPPNPSNALGTNVEDTGAGEPHESESNPLGTNSQAEPTGDTSSTDSPPIAPRSAEAMSAEAAVRDVLKNAMVVFNFEEGTYTREQGTDSFLLHDLSPSENSGHYIGEMKFEDGVAGQAFVYDGVARAIHLPDFRSQLINGRDELTISFWHRMDSRKFGLLFDCGTYPARSLNIATNYDGSITINIGRARSMTTSRRLTHNTWHHMAMVFKDVLVELYVDGELFEAWGIRPTRLDSTIISEATTHIGGQTKSYMRGERFYHGLIDEFTILPEAIDAETVRLLYEWTNAGNVLPSAGASPGQ